MGDLSRSERLLLAQKKAQERQQSAKPQSHNDDAPDVVIQAEEEILSRPAANQAACTEKTLKNAKRLIFKPKSERKTLNERERIRKAEEEAEKAKTVKAKSAKVLSHDKVKELVQEDAVMSIQAEDKNHVANNMPDDTDYDTADDMKAWRDREVERIIRDITEREDILVELADTERRRNLTDAEREHERAVLEAQLPSKDKGEYNYQFLQKWYHQGAFFQDEIDKDPSSIYLRDFSQPTQADLINKAALPKPMQQRRGQFGMKGATKYTHLKDQDTTAIELNRYPALAEKRKPEIFSRADMKKRKL